MDITLKLNNTIHTTHTLAASIPKLQHKTPKIIACRQPRCSTCNYHLLTTTTFKDSRRTATTYRIRHQLSCTSTNIIYLITCRKCKKQYVGYTTKQLNTRINHHRSNILNKWPIYISQHFNLPDHSLSDLNVQPIDKATETDNTTEELHKLEHFWIKTLHTLAPEGLNISSGMLDM